jgi:hypothetical protein
MDEGTMELERKQQKRGTASQYQANGPMASDPRANRIHSEVLEYTPKKNGLSA